MRTPKYQNKQRNLECSTVFLQMITVSGCTLTDSQALQRGAEARICLWMPPRQVSTKHSYIQNHKQQSKERQASLLQPVTDHHHLSQMPPNTYTALCIASSHVQAVVHNKMQIMAVSAGHPAPVPLRVNVWPGFLQALGPSVQTLPATTAQNPIMMMQVIRHLTSTRQSSPSQACMALAAHISI